MPEDIISLDNERIKSARKLLTARGRAGAGRFLLEGLRLVEEAFGSGVELEVLFYTQDFLENHRGRHLVEEVTGLGGKAWSVSQRVLRSLSETETPQGVVAVAIMPHSSAAATRRTPSPAGYPGEGAEEASEARRFRQWVKPGVKIGLSGEEQMAGEGERRQGWSGVEVVDHPQLEGVDEEGDWVGLFRRVLSRPSPLILIADGLQDPGNLGTMIRTADAAGADGVFTTPGTVDLYNPKVLRASMGSLFHLPVLPVSSVARLLSEVTGVGLMVLAADAGAEENLYQFDLRGPVLFAVGNEGAGVSPLLLAHSRRVAIPMPGRAESLNAAVAASILLFEAVRQRRQKHMSSLAPTQTR